MDYSVGLCSRRINIMSANVCDLAEITMDRALARNNVPRNTGNSLGCQLILCAVNSDQASLRSSGDSRLLCSRIEQEYLHCDSLAVILRNSNHVVDADEGCVSLLVYFLTTFYTTSI